MIAGHRLCDWCRKLLPRDPWGWQNPRQKCCSEACSRKLRARAKKGCPCGCGKPVPISKGRRKRLYAERGCGCRVARRRRADGREGRYRSRNRVATLGRVCKHCQATDAEVAWSRNLAECEACSRARYRLACPKCGAPVARWCVACDKRPPEVVEVILVEDGPAERERIVWRQRMRGWVSVKNEHRRVTGSQIVVALPTEQWLQLRR